MIIEHEQNTFAFTALVLVVVDYVRHVIHMPGMLLLCFQLRMDQSKVLIVIGRVKRFGRHFDFGYLLVRSVLMRWGGEDGFLLLGKNRIIWSRLLMLIFVRPLRFVART